MIVTYIRFVEFIILLFIALTMTRFIPQRCLEMSDLQENNFFFFKKSMHIECLALHICLPFRLKKRNNNLCKKLSIFLKNGVASTIFSNSQPFVEKLSRNSLLCKQYRCLVFNSLFLKTCYSWFEKDSLRNCHWFSKMYSYKTRGWVKKFPRSIFIQLAERQEKIK